MTGPVRRYDATYSRFQLDARQRVRLDTYGQDLGQNGWLTIDEWRTALGWLGWRPGPGCWAWPAGPAARRAGWPARPAPRSSASTATATRSAPPGSWRARRASIGDFVFALRGEDERLLREAGFELVRCQDTTASVARVARRWHDARARHRPELLEDEGEETFTGMQRFLATVAALAEQRRLSRYTCLARKEATPC